MPGLTRHQCIACGADTIRLSRWYTRRRESFKCTNCGVSLERFVPRWPYHLANLVLGMLGSLAVPAILFCLVTRQWLWILWISAAIVVVAIGVQIGFSRISIWRRTSDAIEPFYQRRFQNDSFESDSR